MVVRSYCYAPELCPLLAGSAESLCRETRLWLSPLLSSDKPGLRLGKKRPFLSIHCTARPPGLTGKVGTHKREGNTCLALFGVRRSRHHLQWKKKLDLATTVSGMLPYAVVVTAMAALLQPATFLWVQKSYYAPALGGIMLSIGLQLSLKDFATALKRPLPVVIGYITQYFVKPVLGLIIAKAFHIPSEFAAGFILTASVAGAQLSSYASYLGKGDVALSIVLTSLTTITSVFMTPILTRLLIGSVVPVNALAMAVSIMQVVLCPVTVGLILNTYARSAVDTIRPVLPLVAMLCTSICIGGPLSLNRDHITSIHGVQLILPVVIFHTAAFACGYWISRLPVIRQDEKIARTLSLSAGMQSSTLAGLLATQFLGGSHAVPPACSVVVMAVMGLSFASFWGNGSRFSDCFWDWYHCNVSSQARVSLYRAP